MLKTLIEKEIRDLIGSSRFAVTFGVCAVLVLLAFWIGASNYKVSLAQYEASKAQNLRQMEGITDWMNIEQHRIFLPPEPLASLVCGVSNDIGRTVEVTGATEPNAYDSRYNDEPVFAVFRFLDLEFVFQVIFALLAILFGYDAISGEKERGTLRLVFANAVSKSTFILGKLIGSFVALAVSLLLAICVGCLLLPLLGVPMTGGDWLKLGLIVLTGLLYFAVFLTLSIMVSALTQRSSSSFLMLLVVWIAAVLIIPRASVLLAGRAVDVPSVDAIAAKRAAFTSELWDEFRTGMSTFRGPATENMDDAVKAFTGFMDSISAARDAKEKEYTDRLHEERQNAQLHQQRVAFGLARVSPSTSLTLALAQLANTSIDLKDRFYDAGQAYLPLYQAFMTEKTGMNVGGGRIYVKVGGGPEEQREPINPAELPEFVFPEPPLAETLSSALVDMGILVLFGLGCFAGAFAAFVRYDVR
jgi:ABC-type transport system involved in multi-copper enzyme maturation permease subunit